MKNLKGLLAVLTILFAFFNMTLIVTAQTNDPVEGYWKSVDEDTGKATAFWHFQITGGTLYGYVIDSPTMKPGDKCDKCKDEFKDKPITGTAWLKLEKRAKDGVWEKGYIIDTRDGKQYKAKVWVEDGKLKVRGYIAFVYRTQEWLKTTKAEVDKGFK